MEMKLRRPAAPTSQRLTRKLRRISRRAQRPIRHSLRRWLARPGSPTQIHLSWSEDPSTTLTVTWQTPTRRNSAHVEVRDGKGEPIVRTEGETAPSPAGSGFLHRAVVRGLRPDHRYAYRVSADEGVEPGWSDWYGTRTAPAANDVPIEAVFLCDVGIGGRSDGTTGSTASVLDQIARENPLLYLGGGDYAYGNRDLRHADPGEAIDRWFQQMEPLLARAPFMAQYGNHEIELTERFDDWGPRFAHPPGIDDSRSYSFDVGPVHFVGLYAPGRSPSDRHLVWLERDLSSEAARHAAWRIVFQHAPLLAHGRSHPARTEVRALAPLFDRLGVDLHLSGHDQSYERTHPLREGADCHAAAEGDDPTRYRSGSGVVYAKVSPAGKLSERTGGFSHFEEPPAPEIAVRNDQHHHWASLRITEDELEVRIEGLARDGAPRKTIDHFVLARRG
jgi:hypothetical protein